MSRLYYDPEVRAQLRARFGGAPEPASDATREFFTKVAALVPVEILALWTTISSGLAVAPDSGAKLLLKWVAWIVCLGFVPIYLYWVSKSDGPTAPRIIHIVVSMFAFVLWSYTLSGPLLVGNCFQPLVITVMVPLFSTVSGWIPLRR